MLEQKHLTLTEAPRALRELGTPTTYHRLWARAVDGRIPAYRIDGRWRIGRDDLPEIARILS